MRPLTNKNGNWSLIGILASAAIIAILTVVYFSGSGDVSTVSKDSELLGESEKQTTVGKSMDRAKDTECMSQLRQIRSAIDMYKISSPDGANPPSLTDLDIGASSKFFTCPVSGNKYVYDAATGKVKCVYAPHKDY